jgi:predicted secreted hydrolase
MNRLWIIGIGCRLFVSVILLILFPSVTLGAEAYKAITGPCNLEFPRDHGAHPGFRTEWWYYTGNVSAPSGARFGFQLTFFRSQLLPTQATRRWPQPASAWRSNQIYLAHAALTDISQRKFYTHERMLRGALDAAGVVQQGPQTTVFIRDWKTKIEPLRHQLKAISERFSIDMTLISLKPPILHGNNGYSLKGRTPERSSCYYSMTRLKSEGVIRVGPREYEVTGESWMDHEFSSAPLAPELEGWDWFSLQLSDQTEIMIYLLREKQGGFSPASSGTFVTAEGLGRHLAFSEIKIKSLDTWRSAKSGAVYPSAWRLSVPTLDLELTVEPNVNDQELQTTESTNVTYWEGSVSAKGRRNANPVTGAGYVELTGYAKAFDAPM